MASAEETDVTARLLWLAERAPHSPAFLAAGRKALTFGSLAQQIHRTAAKLSSWGIGRGDIVVWANGERSETAVALASLPASSTIAVLNPAATFDALRDAMARMRPKAVVVPPDADSAIVRAARLLGVAEIQTLSEAGEAGAFDLTLAHPTASLEREPRVSAEWVGVGVTSGSTGRPKIVSYGHRQVIVTARATVFHETTDDAIFSQLIPGSTTVSRVQNIAKVRTTGFELAYTGQDVFTRGLDLGGSLTFADSKTVENPGNQASVGKWQPRVPRWRSTVFATYKPDDRWAFTVAARYSGKQYSTLDNSDVNGYAYTGVSPYFTVDLRVRYQIAKQWSAAFGIDNANNYQYWNFHPYPQRTYTAELRFDL